MECVFLHRQQCLIPLGISEDCSFEVGSYLVVHANGGTWGMHVFVRVFDGVRDISRNVSINIVMG